MKTAWNGMVVLGDDLRMVVRILVLPRTLMRFLVVRHHHQCFSLDIEALARVRRFQSSTEPRRFQIVADPSVTRKVDVSRL